MKEGKSSAKLNNNNHQQQQHQNGHFSPFKLAKLLDPEASWDKDQLGDVLHWIRQVVALVCGLLWGAIPLVGGIWIALWSLTLSCSMGAAFTRLV
ncbi:respirasome Complex Assembly Factor 1-like [Populus alba x Populus x berolinensis]|uniref:Respirasome Complex Assembly Factor 1-like n=1 Tax=Populus alba x Populus x berolinensis TaxID=444605 RepID=A0AAD6WHL4_9ROSI|nr:respirasome Complex Assembly Factor 1-like [Populus alba x Populus x berolinensis]